MGVWWWAVGRAALVWSEQYPKGVIISQAGLSLELLPPAVSKEGGLPVTQPGSSQIAAFHNQLVLNPPPLHPPSSPPLPPRSSWLPESCWDGMPARSSLQLPPILLPSEWETNEVMASCKQ